MTENPRACSVEGCERVVVARGMCRRHYARMRTTGDPGPVGLKRMPDKAQCSVEGCDKPNESQGYCGMHRWRIRTYGEPGAPGRIRKRRDAVPPAPCAVDGCDRLSNHGSPYCKMHRERLRRTGEVGAAQPLRVKGVVNPRSDGYVRLNLPDGRRVMQHVLTMEQHLGRRLVDGENVHHKNGVKSDNDLSNLELWLVMQPTGQRVDDLMKYIAEYHADAMRRLLDGEEGLCQPCTQPSATPTRMRRARR